jgi:LysR family transcriptional activator of glutamate synthase operon
MDLQQLRVFREAARSGGFTRASEELHLSQSTISLHMKRLEEELGNPLFLRTRRRVYLNEAGEVLLEYAERILQEVKNAEMAVRELGRMERGTIRLGSGATTVTYRLPKILAAYQRKYPQVELIVTTDSSENLANAVHQQKLDVAVVMLPVQPSYSIEILPLLHEEMVFVIGNNHPSARKKMIEPREISELSLISYFRGSAMQGALDRAFAAMRVTPRITMEMENIEAIKALVRAGLGAGILPSCSVAGTQGANLHELRVRNFPIKRELALALPRASVLPRSIHSFAARLAKGLSGRSISEIRAEITTCQSAPKSE